MADQQRVPVGIRFKEAGKVYYFDARGYDLDVGNYVVVETSHGQEVGRVVIAPDQVIVTEIKETLKPIQRLAAPDDVDRAAELKKAAEAQLATARNRVDEQGLDMRVVGGDYSLDSSQLTFYYTAEKNKGDARSIARDLSSELDTRVQLLQVGDRDRAKMVDGIGRCGERLCCSSWMTAFPTVSIRMAKDQDLPVNPSKLSGACGRLLCCLTYEHEQYRAIKGGLPKVGARVSTPTGDAKVLKINVPKETISLLLAESSERVEVPLDEFRMMYGTAVRPKALTETLEKQLMEAAPPETPAPARRAPARRTPSRRPRPAPERKGQDGKPKVIAEKTGAPKPAEASGEGQKRRRRRRRRGGRRRRRGGGGGGGGGSGGSGTA